MTKNEHAQRLTAFFAALEARGLGAAVLDRRADIHYFTGYTGSDAVAVLSVKKRAGWLVTDSRYTEEAELTAPGMTVTLWKDGFAPFVGRLLKKITKASAACTPASMTAAFYAAMTTAAGEREWQDAGPGIAALRAVKSPAEIKAVKTSLATQEQAFLTAKARWRVGMTETEVKNDLEWEMRRAGADDVAFETIVAVGPNASLAHAHAGRRKLQAGKMLLIDFGAIRDRYCGDLTRTLWPGDIPAVWEKRYRAVLEAQAAGLAAIRAGASGAAAQQNADKAFARHGLAEKFIHSLGHGVGLAVHEEPRLSRLNDKPLVAGNIVTVEPGVYFPGSGGIRVEDMVVVTEGGAEVLSTLPKGVEDMVLY